MLSKELQLHFFEKDRITPIFSYDSRHLNELTDNKSLIIRDIPKTAEYVTIQTCLPVSIRNIALSQQKDDDTLQWNEGGLFYYQAKTKPDLNVSLKNANDSYDEIQLKISHDDLNSVGADQNREKESFENQKLLPISSLKISLLDDDFQETSQPISLSPNDLSAEQTSTVIDQEKMRSAAYYSIKADLSDGFSNKSFENFKDNPPIVSFSRVSKDNQTRSHPNAEWKSGLNTFNGIFLANNNDEFDQTVFETNVRSNGKNHLDWAHKLILSVENDQKIENNSIENNENNQKIEINSFENNQKTENNSIENNENNQKIEIDSIKNNENNQKIEIKSIENNQKIEIKSIKNNEKDQTNSIENNSKPLKIEKLTNKTYLLQSPDDINNYSFKFDPISEYQITPIPSAKNHYLLQLQMLTEEEEKRKEKYDKIRGITNQGLNNTDRANIHQYEINENENKSGVVVQKKKTIEEMRKTIENRAESEGTMAVEKVYSPEKPGFYEPDQQIPASSGEFCPREEWVLQPMYENNGMVYTANQNGIMEGRQKNHIIQLEGKTDFGGIHLKIFMFMCLLTLAFLVVYMFLEN